MRIIKYLFGIVLAGMAVPSYAHSLAQAIQMALASNPELLTAKQGVEIAHEQLSQAKAGWYPSADIAVDWGKEHSDKPNISPTRMWTHDASLTVKQMIFNGGAISAGVERSEQMQQMAVLRHEKTRNSVSLSAIEVWFELYRLKKVLELIEDNYVKHQRIYQQIEMKVKAGAAAKAELNLAEAQLLGTLTQKILTQGQYQDALARYVRIVGEAPPQSNLGAHIPTPLAALPKDISGAMEVLREKSFDLRSAEANKASAAADHKASKAGLMPTLDLQIKAQHKENMAGAEGGEQGLSAFLKLNYNLMDGGADRARLRETAKTLADRQIQEALAQRMADEKLKTLWNALQVSREVLKVSQHQLQSAKVARDAVMEQFKLGEAELMAIMGAEDGLMQAQRALLQEQITSTISVYRILDHLGTLEQSIEADVAKIEVSESSEKAQEETEQETKQKAGSTAKPKVQPESKPETKPAEVKVESAMQPPVQLYKPTVERARISLRMRLTNRQNWGSAVQLRV